jgi:hypothetical protein
MDRRFEREPRMSTTEPRTARAGARHARRLFPILIGAIAFVILLSSGVVSAQAAVSDPWTNPSFNTGDLTAW